MRNKKMLLYLVMLLMVLLTFFNTSQSYAYWSSISLTDIATGTVEIGEWTQTFEWNATTTYAINEIVTYNGVDYISLRDGNNNKIPGANNTKNWWAAV